ncbi:MAG: NAD(P)/FAD-dependent oxidoreductase [Planctomycetota bacterium]|nr:MAG: NAD(P)/FAD-dependent oxidoreductase [Planctomycetota bacterium]
MQEALEDCEVLIVGAGPAGTVAAALLAQAGHRVGIIERDRFPRFQIGESLLPRCMDHLAAANLLPALEARGYARKHGAWFLRGDERSGFDFAEQFSGGYDYTWQVPRDDFDLTLAEAVMARGVPIAWEHQLEHFRPASGPGEAPELSVRHGDRIQLLRPRWVLDASGYGRVLARSLDLCRPVAAPPRRALFTHTRGDQRECGRNAGRIWACIHPDQAWIWVIPFADGRTSVGMVAEPDFFQAYPDDPAQAWQAIVASEPNLRRRLAGCQPLFPPRSLADYSATVSRLHGPGYTLLGNAAEFLDPIFSSGVTLALESARLASESLQRQLKGETVDWDASFERPIRQAVDVFRSYVQAWYDGRFQRLIFAEDSDPAIRRMLCSVLAGHVDDKRNPFVAQHRRKLDQLLRVLSAPRSL